MPNTDFTQKLQNLMQQVNISSFRALSRAAGVSERQILRLRQGKLEQMRMDVLLKLSLVLQMPLSELVATFLIPGAEYQISSEQAKPKLSANSTQHGLNQSYPLTARAKPKLSANSTSKEIADLKREYQRSQLQLEEQRELLLQEFQQSSLQLLESLLLQWPTAAQKAQENPQLAAIKIVPLVQKPLEKLLQAWGVEAIASVGAEIPYDPQLHQLFEGNAQPGERVKVRYTGYLQGDKLLYRAKVSPVRES
ncbi:nucleotide exchange factor GrpE [Komarekiella sp. 'clone 1']|uniref:Nucleotide exchange factor GrpE n=1 Tax=Komarekiella delphini-convector SJRDD-AB1 TaxID=2593771 RepID=A0AA40T2V4_9NOST|nr:nucleotide exchange factor GrpE [Komarekiella delphini-convector]MBD6619916.1 nucleotide exchange factor GrpE [Komarekiella delphini-convector SJRDD-AB1]